MKEIKIRKGQKKDMPQVFALVKELAEYEKAPEQVETSPEIYVRDGYESQRPFFECFVAENDENEIVGIAFFYIGYSTWKGKMLYLDDLVIAQAWRRKGIGNMLLNQLVSYGHSQGVNQVRWHVLDWNEPAINMYKKIGAEIDPEWITCRLSGQQIREWVDHNQR